jgi:hypothetical protein
LFGSGAVEVPVTSRISVTGALIQMRSVNESLEADQLGLPKSRLDVAGAAAYFLAPSIAVFGSVGRTISDAGPLGTSLTINGGVTIGFPQVVSPRP